VAILASVGISESNSSALFGVPIASLSAAASASSPLPAPARSFLVALDSQSSPGASRDGRFVATVTHSEAAPDPAANPLISPMLLDCSPGTATGAATDSAAGGASLMFACSLPSRDKTEYGSSSGLVDGGSSVEIPAAAAE
jgi:hypothetical protein